MQKSRPNLVKRHKLKERKELKEEEKECPWALRSDLTYPLDLKAESSHQVEH